MNRETLQTKRKNILIITLHADPAMPPGVGEWGGTHTYMRELLTELCDQNYNIILITRKVYILEEDIEYITLYTFLFILHKKACILAICTIVH